MQRTFRCDPIQVSQWKRQLLDGASELFSRGKKTTDKEEGQAKETELLQQIGRLQMELEWLKKASAPVMPVNYASWSITSTLKTVSAANVRCWGCRDPRCTTGPNRCGNRRCRSWQESMLSIWRIPTAAAAEWWASRPEIGSQSVVTE